MTTIFSWTFYLHVATFQHYLHMDFISFNWYDNLQLVIPVKIPLRWCCWHNDAIESVVHSGFMVATVTWLIVTHYRCHLWQRYNPFVIVTVPSLVFFIYHRRFNKCIMKGITSGAGTICLYGEPEITCGFSVVRFDQSGFLCRLLSNIVRWAIVMSILWATAIGIAKRFKQMLS